MDDLIIQARETFLDGGIDGLRGRGVAAGLVGFVEFTSNIADEGLAKLGRCCPTT